MKTKIENLENGEIKFTINLPKEDFEKFRENGFKKVQEFVQIDGFRKGNVPEDLIVKKYGDMIILEEMGHIAINETYYIALIKENENRKEDEKIIPISQPKINIVKIGQGSDFEYEAVFPVLPKIDLPDYKKISKEEIENIEKDAFTELKKKNDSATKDDILRADESEIDEVLETLRKGRSTGSHMHEDGTVHTESHNHEEDPENNKEIEDKLPELDDIFAQGFGEEFKTLSDLRNKVKENLVLEKSIKLKDKKRTSILEKLVSNTKVSLPDVLIEDELNRMNAQMKADIERFGGKWEDYLQHVKKTEDELKNEWKEVAHKRVMSQLIINEIVKKEKIKVSKEEIDVEALKVLAQMPEANENHVNSYVEQILLNEKVMKLLAGE